MNQAQRELLDEVGLGTLLALAWSLAVLILLFIHPTPPILIVGTAATTIGVLFAVGVGSRWLYLGRHESAVVTRKRPGSRLSR